MLVIRNKEVMMYQQYGHLDMHRLNAQQHISLEKHRQMVDNALKWQRLSKVAEKTEKPVAMRQLRVAWATVLNLLIGR